MTPRVLRQRTRRPAAASRRDARHSGSVHSANHTVEAGRIVAGDALVPGGRDRREQLGAAGVRGAAPGPPRTSRARRSGGADGSGDANGSVARSGAERQPGRDVDPVLRARRTGCGGPGGRAPRRARRTPPSVRCTRRRSRGRLRLAAARRQRPLDPGKDPPGGLAGGPDVDRDASSVRILAQEEHPLERDDAHDAHVGHLDAHVAAPVGVEDARGALLARAHLEAQAASRTLGRPRPGTAAGSSGGFEREPGRSVTGGAPRRPARRRSPPPRGAPRPGAARAAGQRVGIGQRREEGECPALLRCHGDLHADPCPQRPPAPTPARARPGRGRGRGRSAAAVIARPPAAARGPVARGGAATWPSHPGSRDRARSPRPGARRRGEAEGSPGRRA